MQLKLFHFQTKDYGAHKASDKYLDKFASNFDRFMEVAQGIFGKLNIKNMEFNFSVVTDETIRKELSEFVSILKKFDTFEGISNRTDLLTIRDEMMADAEQLKYLLTFK